MKKSKKLIALLLTACMVAALLTGCGNNDQSGSQDNNASNQANEPANNEANEPAGDGGADETPDETPEVDISEHVVLTMYCIGDEGGIYADQHLDKLNQLLTEKINAELEPIMVSWGEYGTKLPMAWASGEAYDLTYAANWTQYFTEAAKGAFMDITELFPQYAPLTYAEMYDNLESTKVNGKLYMVPAEPNDWTTFIYNYREDLRKKYDCPEIVDYETLEIFLDTIKEKEPGMMPIANSGGTTMLFTEWLNEMDWARPIDQNGKGVFTYDLKNPTALFNLVETPEYEEFIKKMREYYENGYWSQSIIAETADVSEQFRSGKAAAAVGNFSTCNGHYQEFVASHPDWEIGLFSPDLQSGVVESIAPSNNGVCVGAYSKNPERALMFVELIYQDQEVYDVMMHGLEGITFEADRERGVKWIPEGIDASTISLRNLGMAFGKIEWQYGSLNDSPMVDEMKEEYRKVSVFPELAGFALNRDDIDPYLSALQSIYDEFKNPLEKGTVDPETGLATLRQQIKDAGGDIVLEEMNRQLAEYLAR